MLGSLEDIVAVENQEHFVVDIQDYFVDSLEEGMLHQFAGLVVGSFLMFAASGINMCIRKSV